MYGYQWRSWPAPDGRHIDQIANLMAMLKKNPDSRRLIVSAWNPALIDEMALPPCHALFQFYVADGKLSCQLYQRSADIFLGVPFNIASYALLTLMVAQVAGLQPGEFIWTGGDCHLYANHLEQADLQLTREPLPLPSMKLNPEVKDLFDFRFEDFRAGRLRGPSAHQGTGRGLTLRRSRRLRSTEQSDGTREARASPAKPAPHLLRVAAPVPGPAPAERPDGSWHGHGRAGSRPAGSAVARRRLPGVPVPPPGNSR